MRIVLDQSGLVSFDDALTSVPSGLSPSKPLIQNTLSSGVRIEKSFVSKVADVYVSKDSNLTKWNRIEVLPCANISCGSGGLEEPRENYSAIEASSSVQPNYRQTRKEQKEACTWPHPSLFSVSELFDFLNADNLLADWLRIAKITYVLLYTMQVTFSSQVEWL